MRSFSLCMLDLFPSWPCRLWNPAMIENNRNVRQECGDCYRGWVMKEVTSQSTVVLSNVSISDKSIWRSCAELKMIVVPFVYLQRGQVYRLMPHGNDRQCNCAMSNVFKFFHCSAFPTNTWNVSHISLISFTLGLYGLQKPLITGTIQRRTGSTGMQDFV